MGRRGPTSNSEKTAAMSSGKAPKPPSGMTPGQCALWSDIIASEPEDFFNSVARLHLLRLFVEHATFRADLQALIDRTAIDDLADPKQAKTLETMLRSRDRETKQLLALATKLRLTNQSRYTPKAADTAGRNNLAAPLSLEDDPFARFVS